MHEGRVVLKSSDFSFAKRVPLLLQPCRGLELKSLATMSSNGLPKPASLPFRSGRGELRNPVRQSRSITAIFLGSRPT